MTRTLHLHRIGSRQLPWAKHRATASLLGFFALLVILPGPSEAQLVRGLVVDEATGNPVATAQVELLDLDEEELRSTATDREGRFLVQAPEPGSYLLRVSRIGYQATTSDTLHLPSAEEAVEVTLRLGVEAVALDPLTVVQRSRIVHDATYDGLYARHATTAPVGPAKVFVKGDTWFEVSIKASDLLRLGRPLDRCQGAGPAVFWHGFLVVGPERAEFLLDVSVDYLEGVEIYRSWNWLPIDYRLQLESMPYIVRTCGVVALWPRRPDYPR